ncbi:MAG: hypothetical protein ACRCYR_04345 [Phycicoccus sp.]
MPTPPRSPASAATAPSAGRVRRGSVHAGVVGAATLLANVLAYGAALVLNRVLTPDELGAVAALLAVSVLAGVPALALQLVGARHVATDRTGVQRTALRTGAVLGGAASAVVLASSPVLAPLFDLDGPLPVVLVAAAVFPTFLVHAVQGCLHGEERFVALGVVYVVTAGLRFAAAAGAALLGLGVAGVVALTAVGAWLAAGAATTVLLPAWRRAPAPSSIRPWLRAVVHGSTATAALLAVTTMDTPLARTFLRPEESGDYAVLAVFSKAAFWGPAFLATLFYPRMARGSARFGPVAAVGSTVVVALTGVAAAAALSGPLIALVGGAAYADLEADVALFTAVGATWSIVQVLVYWRLARGDHRLGYVVWLVAAGCAVVVVAARHDSVREIATTMLWGGLGAAGFGVALLVTARGRVRRARAG